MVHHLVLCKLKPGTSEQQLEEMMRRTRMSLLKIDVALSVQCGRNVCHDSSWGFFVAIDVNSMEKLAAYKEHAIYIKYMEEVLKPNTADRMVLDYELDPNRLSRYTPSQSTVNAISSSEMENGGVNASVRP